MHGATPGDLSMSNKMPYLKLSRRLGRVIYISNKRSTQKLDKHISSSAAKTIVHFAMYSMRQPIVLTRISESNTY